MVAIAGAALVVILALVVGGFVVNAQAQAPAGVGQQFCADLQTQSYAQGYQLLSAGLRATMTPAQFAAAAATLDQVEGKITACAADASGYAHGPFDKTATAAYIVTRAHAEPSEGTLNLKSESGSWRVDAIGTALLGANLGAVVAVNSYCAALTSQRYADAYALLDAKVQAATKQADYVQTAQWHETLDGQLIVCALTGVGTGQSDTAASFTLTVTRTIRGVFQGAVTLTPGPRPAATPAPTATPVPTRSSATPGTSGTPGPTATAASPLAGVTWRITSVAPSLQGTDTAPLQAAQRFCGDLGAGNYADIYAMASKAYLNGESEAQVAGDLSGKTSGVKWASCTLLDVSGYKLQGTRAYVNIEYQAQQIGTGYSFKPQGTLEFVKQGDTWLLNSRQGLH
jgi:hypothetical protein